MITFTDQNWSPTKYTPPLCADFATDGDRLIELAEKYYRLPDGTLMKLDIWQKALIRHVLEIYPEDHQLAGKLRFRQVVISMGRQNGKSILAALFSLYGLLQHVPGPSVIGVAKSVEQAGVVYQRTEYAVRQDPTLFSILKPSGTRGIRRRDGSGSYTLKASLDEGLQSVPITMCLADELHLTRASMWDSIVAGQRAQDNALILGITTAGDANSALLIRLYDQGEKAISGDGERFGFFLWTAPQDCPPLDPDGVRAANPAVACGRIPIERAIEDMRYQPEVDQRRYLLNQFVAALNPWVSMSKWRELALSEEEFVMPEPGSKVVFGIAKTENWEYATITSVFTNPAGITCTQIVESIVRPTQDILLEECKLLAARFEASFAMESASLSGLGKNLRDLNYTAWMLNQNEMCQGSIQAYSDITFGRIRHLGEPLMVDQMPHSVRKNQGETWRVTNRGQHQSDAVLSMICALQVHTQALEIESQLFL